MALGWRQYLLEDYTRQMLSSPLETLPVAYSCGCASGLKCLGKAAFVFECSLSGKSLPGLGDGLITGHTLLNFYLRAIYY